MICPEASLLNSHSPIPTLERLLHSSKYMHLRFWIGLGTALFLISAPFTAYSSGTCQALFGPKKIVLGETVKLEGYPPLRKVQEDPSGHWLNRTAHRLKKRLNVTVLLADELGDRRGSYIRSHRTIVLSAEFLETMKVLKHEVRHAIFHHRRIQGEFSIFDGELRGSDYYGGRHYLEELYNHALDITESRGAERARSIEILESLFGSTLQGLEQSRNVIEVFGSGRIHQASVIVPQEYLTLWNPKIENQSLTFRKVTQDSMSFLQIEIKEPDQRRLLRLDFKIPDLDVFIASLTPGGARMEFRSALSMGERISRGRMLQLASERIQLLERYIREARRELEIIKHDPSQSSLASRRLGVLTRMALNW